MPRQTYDNLPATRSRGTVDTRRGRRRQPANRPGSGRTPDYDYRRGAGRPLSGTIDPYDRYGYSGYRSQGAANRAQAARFLRGIGTGAVFTYRVGRGAHRHRRRLGALYAVAALAGTGAITALMPSGIVVASIAGAAPSVYAGLKLRSARKRGEAAKLTRGQMAGWAARIATALWLPLTAATGFAAPLRLALVAGSAVGLSWWAVHTRPELEPAEDEVERVGDEEIDPFNAVWIATVGASNGTLSGSYLIEPRETETGWEGVVQLVRGRQRPETALSAVGLIASAFGVDPTRVMVTRMPDGRADQVAIAVYLANPLREVREFTRPSLDLATGWASIGAAPDGAPAMWRLFEPGSGPCGGLLFGSQGSGKSALANALAAEITHSGIAVLWLADGQEGLSMPDWADGGAKWFGYSLRETRRVLQAAEQVMLNRQQRRRRIKWIDEKGRERRGKASFDGTPEEPYLYVMVDEWPIVAADPECRRIVALLLKAGRKVGITCIVIGQIPSVAEFGGDNDASVIRSLASTTNVAMFRLAPADKASQHMGGMGVDGVDPTSIPAAFPDGSGTQGMGYLRAPGGTASVFRSNKVTDPIEWAETAPDIDLEDEAIDAAGDRYLDWRDRYDQVTDGEDDPADLNENEQQDATNGAVAPLARIPHQTGPRDAVGGQVVPIRPDQQINPREGSLKILRGTGQIMSTAQITTHFNALTGSETAVNSITAALKRAAEDGEVIQLPPLPGKDRSARWQAASHATEELNA